MDLLVFMVFWSIALFFFLFNRNGFKNPTTWLIPVALRHTWVSGLCALVILLLISLPVAIGGFPLVSLLIFLSLFIIFRRKSIFLMIDDLRLHRMDGRGIFEHSEDCYMVGGGTATFFKKRREKLQEDPKDLFR